jgi:cell division protein FtsQ
VTRRVEALNLVASASVSKEWPDILNIKVTERVAVVALKMSDASYDLIDGDGVIVRNTATKPAALPALKTTLPGGALRGTPGVRDAASVLAQLQPWLAKQVTQVSAPTIGSGAVQVTLGLKDGKTVVWGGTDHAAQKNRELAILLPGHAQTIDVSSPETVVTK